MKQSKVIKIAAAQTAYVIPHLPPQSPATGHLNASAGTLDEDQIKTYIEKAAKKAGVNPAIALFIAGHESQYNPAAVGDNGSSYGLWQIHLSSHNDITKEEALDYKASTAWAMKEILAGRVNEWSSWRWRDYWYN